MILSLVTSLLLAGVTTLEAQTLRTYEAPDADQGVAVDASHFYAVDNNVIAKHRRDTGEQVGRWDGGKDGPVRHLNSCIVIDARLECANSNYPATPMASSIEWFDPNTLEPVASHSLGLTDSGSLTFTDRTAAGRLAGFAHYSKSGGEPFKGHAYASLVLYDNAWRRTGGYAFHPPGPMAPPDAA